MLLADNSMTSLPSKASSASSKSPVEMPLRYKTGNEHPWVVYCGKVELAA